MLESDGKGVRGALPFNDCGSAVEAAATEYSDRTSWARFIKFDSRLFYFYASINPHKRLICSVAICQFDEADFYSWKIKITSTDHQYATSFSGPIQPMSNFLEVDSGFDSNGISFPVSLVAKCLVKKGQHWNLPYQVCTMAANSLLIQIAQNQQKRRVFINCKM